MKKTFILSNDIEIPSIGYGTYKTEANEEGYEAIINAIKAGYRHIDTAAGYKNEQLIGKAVKESGIDRSEFFITTKLWNDDQGYENTIKAFNRSLENLQMDYVDLYLIHWPIPIGHDHEWKTLNQESWKAMEELYNAGKIKAIGVSNFLVHHMENLLKTATIKPMVNQIEFHIKYQQREIVEYCLLNNIVIESWGPLMRGKAFQDPTLIEMASRYNKSIAQLCVRYCLQHNVLPLQKTMKYERMLQNKDVFDFEITKEDMIILDNCDTLDHYTFHPDRNKEWYK